MLDCQQVRFFPLPSARRLIFGLALCFLAALLAVDAKAAWVACAGHSPNDISAAKLPPAVGKWLIPQATPVLRSASDSIQFSWLPAIQTLSQSSRTHLS